VGGVCGRGGGDLSGGEGEFEDGHGGSMRIGMVLNSNRI
jgi:hypothetical protein